MPKQISTAEEFEKLLPDAREIRVVKSKDGVKLKLRMEDALYTFKTTQEQADSLTKGVKTPIIDY